MKKKEMSNAKGHKLVKISAIIFIIAGLFFMGFAGSGVGGASTGNVVNSGTSSEGSFLEFLLPLGLMIIGAILLFRTMINK